MEIQEPIHDDVPTLEVVNVVKHFALVSELSVTTRHRKRKAHAPTTNRVLKRESGLIVHRPLNTTAEPSLQPSDDASEAKKEPELLDENMRADCDDVDPFRRSRASSKGHNELLRIELPDKLPAPLTHKKLMTE